MNPEMDRTIANLQLMIANLSLDNARLQARVSILEAQSKEVKAELDKKEAANE